MEAFIDKLVDWATHAGLTIVYAVLVLVIGLRLSKFLVKMIGKGRWFSKLEKTLQTFIKSFLTILFNILILISVAVILGVPTASFITLLASAGLAVGMALQGSLSNFAGGIILVALKPFKVGDYVEVSGNSGTVRNITVFYTTLVTFDNKIITVPNGSLTNAAIVNYSAEATRRLDLTFSVDYDADMDRVRQILLDNALDNKLVLKDPEPFAALSVHNDSSLDFVLRVWCNTDDYWTLNFQLIESVKKSFDENGIKIPFPQMDVHVNQ